MTGPPEVLNLASPTANQFGAEPCPQCGEPYRAPYDDGPDAGLLVCDDCGYRAPFTVKESVA